MQLKYWFRLIRPLNLAILAATLYFLDIFILQPNFDKYGMIFSMNEAHFFLLVLSIVLICAGGYIINDYYDVNMDAVNKPGKQIIGKYISQDAAYKTYLIISALGLALGIYLSIYVHFWKLMTIHTITIVLLFFYSASYKKIALLGNIIVSLLTAISIITIGAFEPHLYNLVREADYYAAGLMWRYILGLALFAFLLSMMREITKDLEDMDGDDQFGARTIPVAWGVQAAKGIVCAIITFTVLSMIYLMWSLFDINTDKYYIILFTLICVLLSHILYRMIMAKNKSDYAYLSTFIKITMLLGICVMPLYYFTEF